MFPISYINLVERSKSGMVYKFFLNKNPEDDVINPSSLIKFRRQRLKDNNLLDMLIGKIVEIALDKGIIKSKSIIVVQHILFLNITLNHP